MPGSGFTSMLNAGFPVTIAMLSTPGVRVPRILKSFWSFTLMSVTAIGGIFIATSVREAYVAVLLVRACFTVPEPVVHSLSGTFHCFAAVELIIMRAAAPIWRIGI